MKTSKARILLESLDKNQVLQHKKEKDFYIEYDGNDYIIFRNRKVIAIYDKIKPIETIIKHHDTRNWEIIKSTCRHGFQRIIIPAAYRQGLSDEDISEEFITDCLNRLRSFGEDIPNGPIELVDILETGDIEIYIEC